MCVCVRVFFLIRLLIDVNIHVVSGKKTLKQALQHFRRSRTGTSLRPMRNYSVCRVPTTRQRTHTVFGWMFFFGERVPKKIRIPATNHDDFKAKLSTMNEETGEWWR